MQEIFQETRKFFVFILLLLLGGQILAGSHVIVEDALLVHGQVLAVLIEDLAVNHGHADIACLRGVADKGGSVMVRQHVRGIEVDRDDVGALSDLLVFYLFRRIFEGRMEDGAAVLAATVIARAVSSFINFNLNKKIVFHGQDGYGKTMLRYYCLAVPQMLISAGLVAVLSRWAGTGASVLTTLIKFCVDILLFFVSFRIQQNWVFKGKR